MRNYYYFLMLLMLALLQFNTMNAQKLTDIWRITKKIKTESNLQKFTYEYDYSNDGRIKTVRYLLPSGTTNISIDNFTFTRNNKPSAYVVTYNQEGTKINVSLRYDNSGRVTHVVKTLNPNDITTFTYRYTSNTVIVTEQKTNGQSNLKDNKITYYTEYGDFNETISDAATQVITSTITLKGSRDQSLEPYPDNFMGGFESPRFLGVTAYGTEPQITATKNNEGLITSLTLISRNGAKKIDYTYSKIGTTTPEPAETDTPVIIQTNITCVDGKNQMEALLKKQDGVISASVEIKTGKLSLNYSTDGTPYTEIIMLINNAGFDADGKKSTSRVKNPCIQKPAPEEKITKQAGPNIFDARKNFAKNPIKFVPFEVTPDAAKKGFKMDSIYTWTAPDGKVKQASGEEILMQVNEMEKELSLRGHTLRKRNAFSTLSYKLINPNALLKMPKAVTKISKYVKPNPGSDNNFNKIPIIKTKHNKLPALSNALATTISGDVGIYFGRINSNTGEFQGNISTKGIIDNSKCMTDCPLDITLSLDAKMIQSLNISNCILEISDNPNRKPNDDEDILATANFNFKSYAKTKYGTSNMTVIGDRPPSFHTLYYFLVKLNDLSKLSKAVIQPVAYYAYVKFYNANGQLLYYSSYNTAVLENKFIPPIFISQEKNVNGNFDDSFSDPTDMFGMYYKSNNINAAYKTKRDETTLIISENTKLSGDIEIGAKYYNFWYLLDNDKPKYETKPFIKANFSSDYTKQYKDGAPGIRIPGGDKKSNEMNEYSNYQVNYSLFDGESDVNYNKASQYTETKSVGYNIFDERFFIGPVPCRITVDITGNASFSRQATMDTLSKGNVSISTSVTPHLDLTLTGTGGVDAAIAYAKIVANVKVIEVDLPISAKAGKDADINADLKITALSGQIYFTAGLCIPIPWFDDICTDFRIDIFNWTGPTKTYPLVK